MQTAFESVPIIMLMALTDSYEVRMDYIVGRTENPRINR